MALAKFSVYEPKAKMYADEMPKVFQTMNFNDDIIKSEKSVQVQFGTEIANLTGFAPHSSHMITKDNDSKSPSSMDKAHSNMPIFIKSKSYGPVDTLENELLNKDDCLSFSDSTHLKDGVISHFGIYDSQANRTKFNDQQQNFKKKQQEQSEKNERSIDKDVKSLMLEKNKDVENIKNDHLKILPINSTRKKFHHHNTSCDDLDNMASKKRLEDFLTKNKSASLLMHTEKNKDGNNNKTQIKDKQIRRNSSPPEEFLIINQSKPSIPLPKIVKDSAIKKKFLPKIFYDVLGKIDNVVFIFDNTQTSIYNNFEEININDRFSNSLNTDLFKNQQKLPLSKLIKNPNESKLYIDPQTYLLLVLIEEKIVAGENIDWLNQIYIDLFRRIKLTANLKSSEVKQCTEIHVNNKSGGTLDDANQDGFNSPNKPSIGSPIITKSLNMNKCSDTQNPNSAYYYDNDDDMTFVVFKDLEILLKFILEKYVEDKTYFDDVLKVCDSSDFVQKFFFNNASVKLNLISNSDNNNCKNTSHPLICFVFKDLSVHKSLNKLHTINKEIKNEVVKNIYDRFGTNINLLYDKIQEIKNDYKSPDFDDFYCKLEAIEGIIHYQKLQCVISFGYFSIGTEKFTLELDEIPILENIEYIIWMVRPISDEKNIKISVNMNPSDLTNLTWKTDCKKLQILLSVLLFNAINNTENGGSVDQFIEKTHPSYLKMTLLDSGTGMKKVDPEVLNNDINITLPESYIDLYKLYGSKLGNGYRIIYLMLKYIGLRDTSGNQINIISDNKDGTCVSFLLKLLHNDEIPFQLKTNMLYYSHLYKVDGDENELNKSDESQMSEMTLVNNGQSITNLRDLSNLGYLTKSFRKNDDLDKNINRQGKRHCSIMKSLSSQNEFLYFHHLDKEKKNKLYMESKGVIDTESINDIKRKQSSKLDSLGSEFEVSSYSEDKNGSINSSPILISYNSLNKMIYISDSCSKNDYSSEEESSSKISSFIKNRISQQIDSSKISSSKSRNDSISLEEASSNSYRFPYGSPGIRKNKISDIMNSNEVDNLPETNSNKNDSPFKKKRFNPYIQSLSYGSFDKINEQEIQMIREVSQQCNGNIDEENIVTNKDEDSDQWNLELNEKLEIKFEKFKPNNGLIEEDSNELSVGNITPKSNDYFQKFKPDVIIEEDLGEQQQSLPPCESISTYKHYVMIEESDEDFQISLPPNDDFEKY